MELLKKRTGLTAAMLMTVTLISGCRGQLTVTVPLPLLVNNPASFDDKNVVTQGVVRHFNDPLHYWIEDEHLNRVEIFPHQEIAPYLGESVEVEGQFHFSPNKGRRLILARVDQLQRE
ncbi:glucose-inhibited division protein B [Vreelandella andesensis]|uniref:Glucose-inhibited division protein B n=1 Tax=Vreelandella andesensis TaxID=447567 RepID=A0A433KLC5_9GAMM|nr:hypothetical protein [Halomonas andesensis]RUR30407.1 glucose-inhibited division protein B [Halomonas andesensis]